MTTPWRLLFTGSRDLTDQHAVWGVLDTSLLMTTRENRQLILVHGACPTGGDKLADNWALDRQNYGFDVVVERHPAKGHPTQNFGEWPSCGPRRNSYMVSLGADECVAMVGPCTSFRCRRVDLHPSHGTIGCVAAAEKAGIKVDQWDLWKR